MWNNLFSCTLNWKPQSLLQIVQNTISVPRCDRSVSGQSCKSPGALRLWNQLARSELAEVLKKQSRDFFPKNIQAWKISFTFHCSGKKNNLVVGPGHVTGPVKDKLVTDRKKIDFYESFFKLIIWKLLIFFRRRRNLVLFCDEPSIKARCYIS